MSEDGSKKLQEAARDLSMMPSKEDKKKALEPSSGSFERLSRMFAPRQ